MKKILALFLAFTIFSVITVNASAVGEEKIKAYGVDVSYAQGNSINWNAVKSSGKTFAMLRIGRSWISDSKPISKDTSFEINYTNAKAAGLNVGCYMFCYAFTVQQAENDADAVISWLKGKHLEYPVYYDMENASGSDLYGQSKSQITDIALAFIKKVQAAGYYTGIYANYDWLTNHLDQNRLNTEFNNMYSKYITDNAFASQQQAIWYAGWRDSGLPDADRSQYGIFQYTSEGKVNGIQGNVDLNVAYYDYPAMMKKFGLNGYTPEYTYLKNTGVDGDVNGDGKLGLADAELLSQYVAGWKNLKLVMEQLNPDKSDANTNLKDVICIFNKVMGRS